MNFKLFSIALCCSLFIFSCKCDKPTNNSNIVSTEEIPDSSEANMEMEAEISKLDTDGNYIYEVGAPLDLTLSTGIKLNVGENSSENKLFTQLNSADFTVSDDKTQGWITLDRVYFSTGKADLTGTSENQIRNIVEILKAFPNASVKIGGYTDNTGDATVNKRVSTERAKTVADKIILGGITASRIENEGYGADHFVCPANDTDECKAQNRRVDIRITKK